VGFNVPLDTLQVISETKVSVQQRRKVDMAYASWFNACKDKLNLYAEILIKPF